MAKGRAAARAFLAASATLTVPSHAEEFYKGKTIQIIAHDGPGSSYDAYARLIARFLGKHIPGEPKLLVANMPGAAGVRAINYIENVGPKDGTVISTLSQGIPIDKVIDPESTLKADLLRLGWIGREYQ